MFLLVFKTSSGRNLYRVSTPAGKAGNAGKAGKMSLYSEFGGKNWKSIGFSPALTEKAGILFLSLIIFNAIIR